MNKPTYVPEYQAIVEVLNKYNEGCKQAKSSIMKPAFSEQATMFSVDGNGKLTGGPIQTLFDGIDSALRQARATAGDLDVKIGGGVSTVRQYLQAGAIDELHCAISPVVLGQGEVMFAGIDLTAMGYRVTEQTTTPKAMHVVMTR